MLLGLCGGICAGKRSIAEYLIHNYGFRPLLLEESHALNNAFETENHVRDRLEGPPSFSSAEDLLDFVNTRWREHWVIMNLNIGTESTLHSLLRRPYFLLVSVDAPLSMRWQRYRKRHQNTNTTLPTLEKFVVDNDKHHYDPVKGLAHLSDHAQVRLLNSSNSLSILHKALEILNLINEERTRPSWDQYFMRLASLAAQRSNCMKRRVGCVIVREKRVISTGYNGTPRNIRNCNEGGCPRCNGGIRGGAGLSTCLCIHAEENALLEAGRERIREGSILYCDTCPCLTCSIKIVQVGISEVVFSQNYYMDKETASIFREAGVQLRQFSPPRNGLVDLNVDIARSEIIM